MLSGGSWTLAGLLAIDKCCAILFLLAPSVRRYLRHSDFHPLSQPDFDQCDLSRSVPVSSAADIVIAADILIMQSRGHCLHRMLSWFSSKSMRRISTTTATVHICNHQRHSEQAEDLHEVATLVIVTREFGKANLQCLLTTPSSVRCTESRSSMGLGAAHQCWQV